MKKFAFGLMTFAVATCGGNKNNEEVADSASQEIQNPVATVPGKDGVGSFEVYDFGTFKMHVYNSGDVMGDASYLVEGKDALVAMESPLFKNGEAAFEDYITKLGKPVVTTITDYHLGASGNSDIIEPEGMNAFINGPIYGGMMKGFQKQFGETMVDMPTGKVSEVPFGSTQTYAGVTFRFEKGASSDFPGASIIIGGKVYLTHWTPSKSHPSTLQVANAASVDAELAEAKEALASGCEYFAGGHGGMATKDAVEFKVQYLTKVKELIAANKDAKSLATALRAAYPDLPGDADALANVMY